MEKLIDKIKKNGHKNDVYKEVTGERPLFLYGTGNLAEVIYKQLKEMGIVIQGCIVDRQYPKKFLYDVEVFYVDEIKVEKNKKRFDLLIGNARSYQKKKKIESEGFWANVYVIANPFTHHKHFDYSFVEENSQLLESSYNLLSDRISKDCFVGFLNGRIYEDESFISECGQDNIDEFCNDILTFGENEVFIDIGAYKGDGIKRFIRDVNEKYKKVIGIEAEKENYKKLLENLKNIPDSKKRLIQSGCWKEKGILHFNNTDDKCCRIDETAGTILEVDKIDNLCGEENITAISLGISTCELEIIQGMNEIINKNSPKMIIFMGSAREELYTIPQYIKSIFPQYKLYLRFQTGMLSRLFLYAIPD